MDSSYAPYVRVLVSNLAAGLGMWLAKRFTRLPKSGHFGIYLILVPILFVQLGADLPTTMVTAWAIGGVGLILWSLRKRSVEEAGSAMRPAPLDDT